MKAAKHSFLIRGPKSKAASARKLPTWDELWSAWAPLTEDEKKQLKGATDGGASLEIQLAGLGVHDINNISLRDRADLVLKLGIYKDLVNLFAESQDVKEDRFDKLLKELKGVGMRAFGIEKRVERANEGKEAANKKYKDGNWFGAMYTYAIAWGCLVPFYTAALLDSDPLKKEIEKLEIALFSNMSAMAVSGADDKTIKTPKPINKAKLLHVGLRASVYCMTQADKSTVGIITKSGMSASNPCESLADTVARRACDLSAKLTSGHSIKPALPATITLWKEQEAALTGVKATEKYAEMPTEKKLLARQEGDAGWAILKGDEIYKR